MGDIAVFEMKNAVGSVGVVAALRCMVEWIRAKGTAARGTPR